MVVLQVIFFLGLAMVSECQVKFPSSSPQSTTTPGPEIPDECTASNGLKGSCFEFRSDEFRNCPFFPSTDTSNPEVAKHLEDNTCINTGRQIYFCCPEKVEKIRLPTEEECGKSISNNVVGGTLSDPGQWPWLVALLGQNGSRPLQQFCGGTLITKQHVLTAAHCFRYRYDRTVIRVGEHDLANDDDGALTFEIIDERLDNYNTTTRENDIMLLKLDRPVDTDSDNIGLACLPHHLPEDDFEGEKGEQLIVAGWGTFRYLDEQKRVGIGSPVPMHGTVAAVPLHECQQKYTNIASKRNVTLKSVIDGRQICAGTGDTDACQGDSGGPIHYIDINNSLFYVVGLVSFGPTPCGAGVLPGVYTRIGSFLDWIKENID